MNRGRLKIIIAGVIASVVLLGGGAYALTSDKTGSDVAVAASPEEQTGEPAHWTTIESSPVEPDTPIADQDKKGDAKKEEKKTEDSQEKKSNEQSSSGKSSDAQSDKKKETKSSQSDKQENKTPKATKQENNNKDTQSDWVAKLDVSNNTSELVTVQASGKTAKVQYHKKGSDGKWREVFSTNGYVGYNGITSHKREGDGKTPVGVYSFGTGFGIAGNPGTSLGYQKINSNDYWVDDTHSSHYNEWVNLSEDSKDWKSAEHMISQPVAYKYGITINYNMDRTPGEGSGIFLHCSKGGGTAGCVAIPQDKLVKLMRSIDSSARIVISSYDGIYNY